MAQLTIQNAQYPTDEDQHFVILKKRMRCVYLSVSGYLNQVMHVQITKPEKIYKYTSIQSAEQIIDKLQLKFSNPVDFNDPFDCDVNIVDYDFSETPDPYVLYEMNAIEEMFAKVLPKLPEGVERNKFWEQLYKESQIEKAKSIKVCCFSLENDIVLMWSHYASHHQGICLCFDNSIARRFSNLDEIEDISEGIVDYSAEKRINYISSDRISSIRKVYFSKSSSWQLEKEYRLLLLNQKNEFHQFVPEFLSSVYFGVNTTPENINLIMQLCKEKKLNNLKFYKALKDNLKIKFEEIRQ